MIEVHDRRCLPIMAFALSITLILPAYLRGQTTGSVEGFIRDAETGEALTGVEITIKETRILTTTGSDGYYSILNAPAGLHDLQAELAGFENAVVGNLLIPAGQTQKIDLNMKATLIEPTQQSAGEEVSPLFSGNRTASTQRITDETVLSLPVDNYRDIVTLQPGVVRFDNVDDTQYPISIRGGGLAEDFVYVDGINVKSYQTNQNLFDVPELGIEEMDVITGGYGAEYGEARSGVIDIMTREGSENYSGLFRIETDEFMPSGSNFGYNRAQVSAGGPVPGLSDKLRFFFSGEVTGLGDNHPRSDGFKGRNEDIEWLADLYNNDVLLREFLGKDLDIHELLRTAKSNNPSMPILDLDKQRTDQGEHPGRLTGNEGDETRFQTRITWQASRTSKLTGSFLANRDQGLVFDKRMIFWNTSGNAVSKSKDLLGIIGYDYMLGQSAAGPNNIQLRASFLRNSFVQGPRFNLDTEDTDHFGEDLGFEGLTNILNYRVGTIPVFLEDLEGGQISSLNEVLENYQWNLQQREDRNGRNPFGLPSAGFYDEDVGYYDFVRTREEDRTTVRLDYDSQINRIHRVRTGAELKFWQVDYYSSELTSSSSLDYYSAKPDMESFYAEDRMEYRGFVIDLGLRLDSFDAGIEYPSVLGDQDSELVKSGRKNEVSPRISVAHQLSKRVQVRSTFGTQYQVPAFANLFTGINIDINEIPNSDRIFGNPDLEMMKTTAFEFGFTALLSQDWVLDVTGYNKDFQRDVTFAWIQQSEDFPYLKILVNADAGRSRGIDMVLRKRFNDYFSTELAYSLLSSEGTLSDVENLEWNEGFFIGGGDPLSSPTTSAPSLTDQTHILNAQLSIRSPHDFREGTTTGKILNNTGLYLTLQAFSGRPYVASPENTQRTDWQSLVNLRLTKGFEFGSLDYTIFADIRNLFNTKNTSAHFSRTSSGADIVNGVYQTSGSPYSDGSTVQRAIDDLGVDDPSLYVEPRWTDIDGDEDIDQDDIDEITRRLDFNGDNKVSVEEELAMRVLARGANDADPGNFGIPRLVRLGLEVKF